MLVPSLRRLEISKTKLQIEQLRDVIEFMGNGTLYSVCLRETKLGPKGCELLTNFLNRNEIGDLKYIDISSNGIGAAAIELFLEAASKTSLAGVSVDANFFQPSANSLRLFPTTRHSAVSLKGLHWDLASAELISAALKNRNIKYWDLGAQVVHQHCDPDLSSEITHQMFANCSPDIECLLFANHHLDTFSLTCISHVNLKALSLSNSKIEEDTIETLITLLDRPVWLDLSCNSIVFRSSGFFIAAAASKSLKTLILSHNEIGDGNGRALFEELQRKHSQLAVLRLHNCFLRKHSGVALLELLASGCCSFDELDLGGNEMFHVPIPDFEPSSHTRIEHLYAGGNGSKAPALAQLFRVVSGVAFLDLDRTAFSVVCACAQHVAGVLGLSVCFTRIASDLDLVKLIQDTGAHEIWLVHSTSQRILERLLARFREIPLCAGIRVGADIEIRAPPPIPIIVETQTT
jgi:Ran GTPase-activating protein (RanGAP) involved in mRNA processing and transport